MGTLYARVFAGLYDAVLARGERSGLADLRRTLLAGAEGTVLEIGAGTGLNLPLYPADVGPLTLTEPDAAMRARLVRRLAAEPASRVRPAVLPVPAERLSVTSGSVDTVVSTLVLCTVADVPGTLAEVRRVLRPGGRLLLLEHVRASGTRLARRQDRLNGPWRAFAQGCHCNRDTVRALEDAGFDVSRLRPARWTGMPSVVTPLVVGAATPLTLG